MKTTLSSYFSGIAVKRLSEVEVSPKKSNQHEFNGSSALKRIFGENKRTFSTTYIFISDEDEKNLVATGVSTWYDSRVDHPTRSEFRLYYSSNDVIKSAVAGDLMIVCKISLDTLAIVIAPQGSTSEKQLLWLFGIGDIASRFVFKDLTNDKDDIGFAGRYILSSLGIEIEETAPDYLEQLLTLFGKKFPTTKVFSDFSRSTLKDVSAIEEPDETLIAWIEREELLFKTLEKVIVAERLEKGFGDDGKDVEEFINFSLSVQNRRKSRAGFALENNLALIFSINGMQYSHGAVTERNNKPDFLFPGAKQYHSPSFDVNLLTMLGVKTTAKDRWRQVLSEAIKIRHKHLITLEPSISKNQTDDMIANNLKLVIPSPLIKTYKEDQKKDIIDLKTFIKEVLSKQMTLI